MKLFLSTFSNKIDKKGRVSVPSSFRSVLANQSFAGIIAYGSFINPCIEACGFDRIEKINSAIDKLDPFSEDRDAFATTILSSAIQLPFDNEGRVILPESLIKSAQLNDIACFVGKGVTFEIWNQDKFDAYANKARDHAKLHRKALQIGGA